MAPEEKDTSVLSLSKIQNRLDSFLTVWNSIRLNFGLYKILQKRKVVEFDHLKTRILLLTQMIVEQGDA